LKKILPFRWACGKAASQAFLKHPILPVYTICVKYQYKYNYLCHWEDAFSDNNWHSLAGMVCWLDRASAYKLILTANQ
jgi:hypothetical protein